MSSRRSSVRLKVAALLVSLIALWAFAATVTLREGLNLLFVSTLATNVGDPTDNMVGELQKERRLSLVYLATGTQQRGPLAAQRARTDEARGEFARLARGQSVATAATENLERRISEAMERLNSLDHGRAAIDAGTVDREHAAAIYTDIINAGFRIFGSMSTLDDPQIAKESRTLVALTRAREVLSREDALVAGVLAAGRFSGSEHEQFTQLVGAQRFLYAEAEAELPSDALDMYRVLATRDVFTRFQTLENRIIDTGGPGLPLPVDSAAWAAAADPLFTDMHTFERQATNGTIERAKPAGIGVIIRLLLAGGLGLLAVIASIVMSITTARSLVRQLDKLRTAALELAGERLPSVVERLRRGEEVDVAAEAPPLTFGTDEIGQVGRAFNVVQETAIAVAVEQAELRKGIRDVFLSLARRTQALVHRQLALLDAIERKETKPEELEELFRVDHLATRMRRNAENLIVLSGAVPGRGWRNPVPLVDVVRGAAAEIEDYARVTVGPIGSAALVGRAVGDVTHLLAELVENAASFSPPHTVVQVGGQAVANGFVVEVEDRGLGMSPEDLAAANEELENPPEFNLSSTARLGLYVVGQLAARHDVKVKLRHSPYGGTTAVVLIPPSLVVEEPESAATRSSRHDRLAAGKAASSLDIRERMGAGTTAPAALDRRRERINQRLRPWKPEQRPTDSDEPNGTGQTHPLFAPPPPQSAPANSETPDEDASPDADPSDADLFDDGPPSGRHAAVSADGLHLPQRVRGASGVPGPNPDADAAPRSTSAGAHAIGANGNGRPASAFAPPPAAPVLPSRSAPTSPFAPPLRTSEAERPPVEEAPTAIGPEADPAAFTSTGLPQRVRQANLAGQLRKDPASDESAAHDNAPARSPEEVRRMMGSYQRGLARGRREADPPPPRQSIDQPTVRIFAGIGTHLRPPVEQPADGGDPSTGAPPTAGPADAVPADAGPAGATGPEAPAGDTATGDLVATSSPAPTAGPVPPDAAAQPIGAYQAPSMGPGVPPGTVDGPGTLDDAVPSDRNPVGPAEPTDQQRNAPPWSGPKPAEGWKEDSQ